MRKIIFKIIAFSAFASLIAAPSFNILAQEDKPKVVVVPLFDESSASIQYTGNTPISVDEQTGVISFDTSSLRATSQAILISQPSLVVNCLIAVQGNFPSRNDDYLGDIKYVGFNFVQRGWASCSGQLLAISTNTALFSLLGTIYGGDGRTTFALPDMRGRVPVHQGNGPGLDSKIIGQKYGSETVTPIVNISVTPQMN